MNTTGKPKADKRPLRIAVDISTLTDGKTGTERSGIQTAVAALLDQLQRIDSVNEYLLFETRESGYCLDNPRWKKIRVRTYHIPFILWIQLVFPFYLRRNRADVLWAPKYVCPLLRVGRTRVFTTVYDLTFLRYPRTLKSRDRWILRLLVPFSARRSDAVFTDSEFIRRDFAAHYPSIGSRVIAVPLGRPEWTLPSSYSCRQRENFLFFAGNIEPRKNLLNAVKALEILAARGKRVELQIASPADWKSGETVDYLNRSPVRDSVKFLGYLPLEKLKEKYLSCRALLYPSLYEGFGLPVLEAFAMDCTVLTSKDTVMQETAGDAAVYFNPLDPEDIAEKIALACSDSFERDFYLKHRNRILERHSWETAARTMLAEFENL